MHAEAFEAELREGEVSMGVRHHPHYQYTFFFAPCPNRAFRQGKHTHADKLLSADYNHGSDL